MVKVSDDLKAARARLAVPGVWAQSEEVNEAGRYCMYSATKSNASDDVVKQALGVSYGKEVVEWNDAPGRTLDEVLAVYDKAIVIAEKEEAACGTE